MEKITKIKTPIAEVILHQDPIYMHHILAPVKVDFEEMQAHLDQTFELAKGYPPMRNLVDSRQVRGISKAARDCSDAHDKKHKQTEKLALLVGSGISRIAGNLYLKFSAPSSPTQLFTDEKKAKEWLLSN